ncbi:hypothetical protein [Flavobacterium humi]|uniref:Uncharacterized protein n=1 Tax=Flavobacterium humi TaxID=2562683 RepID=A0A4Z0LCC9_9FLAO|nr:hypothetical protein [Flavobacterium humi]TGD59549.1 hypothetical protein E4635_01030 [Flavobacterium humi]
MTYDMLGAYSFEQINATDFLVSFQIPDNTFFNLSETSGEYTIAIKLNPGEKEPSTTFRGDTVTIPYISNVLDVTFEQYEKSGSIIRKPRTTIEE